MNLQVYDSGCYCPSAYTLSGSTCTTISCGSGNNLLLYDSECYCSYGYEDIDTTPGLNCNGMSHIACTTAGCACYPNSSLKGADCECDIGFTDIDTGVGVVCQKCGTSQHTCDLCHGYRPDTESLTYWNGVDTCLCSLGYFDRDSSSLTDCQRKL